MNTPVAKPLKVYGSICVNGRGEVLLVHGHKSKKWSFPKGHIEKTDEDGLACARRELKEETGLDAPETYLSCHTLKAGIYYLFVFNEDDEPMHAQNSDEIDDIRWWSLTNLPTENCNVDVSMFRTLMKSFRHNERHTTFLSSSFATNRLATIKYNMTRGPLVN